MKPQYIREVEQTTGLTCTPTDNSSWNVLSPTGVILFTIDAGQDDVIGMCSFPSMYALQGIGANERYRRMVRG